MGAGIGRGLGGGERGGGTWASREGGVKGVGGACLVGWKVCFFRLHSFVIRHSSFVLFDLFMPTSLPSICKQLTPLLTLTANSPFVPPPPPPPDSRSSTPMPTTPSLASYPDGADYSQQHQYQNEREVQRGERGEQRERRERDEQKNGVERIERGGERNEQRNGTDRNEQRGSADRNEQQVAQRSRWQAVLLEAGGLSAALSEESMRRLKYCLHWLQVSC